MTQPKADDPESRVTCQKTLRFLQSRRQELPLDSHVRVKKQYPSTSTETTTLIHGAGEPVIALPASKCDSCLTSQAPDCRMRGGMIIDHDCLDMPIPRQR
jgi:hypothetical protein